PHRRAFGISAAIVLPHRFVGAVVEIEKLEVLELAGGRAEEFLANPHVRIHRAADVEEEQQLDRVATLRAQANVEPAAPGGAVDRAVEIEFLGRTLAREAAQAAQRDLDVARAELAVAVKVAELALLPHLDRAPMPPAAADPHALGIVARMAVGRGAA